MSANFYRIATFIGGIVMLFHLSPSSAQVTHYCGTQEGKSEWLKTYQAHPERFLTRSDEWYIVPIKVHVTGEDSGTGYTSLRAIGLAFTEMNVAFEPHKIQFYVEGDINYIDDSRYHNHERFTVGREMMDVHNQPRVVNMYITAVAAGACGYFSRSGDAVVIQEGCLDPQDHTMAHELGHFLSLPHTFVGWEGTDYVGGMDAPSSIGGRLVELASGVNCEDAADGFCDTPPDYLSFRWPCGNSGISNVIQQDPSGNTFRSDGRYIMSYSSGDCRSLLSDEQAEAMRANLEFERPELLGSSRDFVELTECGTIPRLTPESGERTDPTNTTFSWADMGEGVEYYTLIISENLNFTNTREFQVQDTFLVVDDLNAEDNFFWRVDGYAAHSPCMFSEGFSRFRTEAPSSTTSTTIDEGIRVFSSDGYLTILTRSGLQEAKITMYDAAGRQVHTTRIGSASPQFRLPLDQATGAYILHIQENNEHHVERFFHLRD